MCIALIFGLSACTKNNVWVNNRFDLEAFSEKLENDFLIAENKSYELVWQSISCSVALIEKSTNKRWGTTPVTDGEPQFNALGMPIKKDPQLESAVIVKYINPDTNLEEQALSANSAVKEGRVKAKLIEKGVSVEYYFDDIEVMIPVSYVLREDSVEVSVNTENIQENSRKVASISICPFWCSAQNDVDNSYLFYPSGSGALISNKSISQTGILYSSQVYGKDPVMTVNDLVVTDKAIRVPVYGAKSGDVASCAIIEESAESAIINAKVGSKATKHSAIYSEFLLRGYCPNLVNLVQGTDKQLNVYSSSMIKETIKIGFYPLTNQSANYSGMAAVYKDYLKKKGFFSSKSEESFLNITFLGGKMIDKSFLGIPYKELLEATTVLEAEEILKDIKKNIKTSINVRLLGYGSKGVDNTDFVGNFTINNRLGSVSELNNLSKYCSKNNINLYFDFDLLKLKNANSGYNRFFDVAYSSLNKIANLYDYDTVTRSKIEESTYNLLSRELISDAYKKLDQKTEKWDIQGVSFSSLSSVAYSDYSVKNTVKYYSKASMGADVQKILKSASEKFNIAGEDANDYAAVMADVIYNSPTYSSKEQIFEADIPFYQMVFKGYVDLAGEEMNISSNRDMSLLKSIESGCGLNYVLISNFHNEFMDYNGYEFFGSQYSDVKNSIFSDYDLLKDYYDNINGAEILSHKILENGLREVVYDNGITLFVNYTDKKQISSLGEVLPENFTWGRVTN